MRRVMLCAAVSALLTGGLAGTAAATDPPPTPGARPGTANVSALAVAYRRTDGRVVLRLLTNQLGPAVDLGGTIVGGPDVMSLGSGSAPGMRIAATGTNGAVYTRFGPYVAEQPQWGPWTSVGGTAIGEPALGCTAGGTAVFWVRGADDALWRRTPTTPWVKVGGSIRSAPSTAGQLTGSCLPTEYVVALGADGAAWEYRSGTWHRIGGRSAYAPAIARVFAGTESGVFVIGTDGALYGAFRTSDSAPWSAFRKLGGKFTSAPAAEMWTDVTGAGRLTVLALGANGQLYRAGGEAGTPTPWTFVPFG